MGDSVLLSKVPLSQAGDSGASAAGARAHDARRGAATLELSVIVPTFNERDNVGELLHRLDAVLDGVGWEVVFVDDDSPDGTADVVRALARTDARVRIVHRIGRRGLASACIEGMLSSAGSQLAVIDCDLQHDERLLAEMLQALRANRADLVIGSRYAAGAELGAWSPLRARISRLSTRLGAILAPAEITDPLSGFFMMRREAFDACARRLSGIGFKLLLDILASSPRPLRVVELPYAFRSRVAGTSKLDARAALDYAVLVLTKLLGDALPVRFVSFAAVGAVGVCAHLVVLTLAFRGLGTPFVDAQVLATLVAMTSNFALNNVLTFSDRRRRGWRWASGWLTFVATCSVGAVANVAVAKLAFEAGTHWLLAALSGLVIGAVWNYGTTGHYIWSATQRPAGDRLPRTDAGASARATSTRGPAVDP